MHYVYVKRSPQAYCGEIAQIGPDEDFYEFAQDCLGGEYDVLLHKTEMGMNFTHLICFAAKERKVPEAFYFGKYKLHGDFIIFCYDDKRDAILPFVEYESAGSMFRQVVMAQETWKAGHGQGDLLH